MYNPFLACVSHKESQQDGCSLPAIVCLPLLYNLGSKIAHLALGSKTFGLAVNFAQVEDLIL